MDIWKELRDEGVDSGLLDDEKAETARRYLYETYGELPEA